VGSLQRDNPQMMQSRLPYVSARAPTRAHCTPKDNIAHGINASIAGQDARAEGIDSPINGDGQNGSTPMG
jgi:hypothetical protein